VVEIVFLMLVLKLPIVYLIAVVWWAVRAEPRPEEPALLPVAADGEPPLPPRRFRPRGPRRDGPHGRARERRSPARADKRPRRHAATASYGRRRQVGALH
jgi:hypothetical protein